MGAMSQAIETAAVASTPGLEGRRVYFLVAWIVATIGFFWAPVRSVIAFAAVNDDASHIFIIPILAAGVLYLERDRVFRWVSFDALAGGVLAAL